MIEPGAQLGPYEVVAAIGAGGMGEVYRARDPRLKRDVALKLLPPSFAADPDRLARFQREAEVLASLNHPHIAAIYGVEHAGDSRALVLELVEGDTLADRISRGRIPLAEALPIARQIADALEAAHQQGIIHRDLKPANIKLTAEGAVKVLDFGLAAVVSNQSTVNRDATYSPTLTLGATAAGVILGTAAYMSPEQASGKTADKRSDIWSFGVVLWEMLTGRRLFDGETISHTLAFVLTKDPDWGLMPADTPPSVVQLLRRCLERDRRRRLPDIGAARLELEDAMSAPAAVTAPPPETRHMRLRRAFPWAVTALMAIALASFVMREPDAPSVLPLQLSVELGADVSLAVPGNTYANLALSPVGDLLAFVAEDRQGQTQLYLRRLNQLQATPLTGTANARHPFFKPDGQWLAFFADGKLKRVSITGGAAITLADAPASRGGSWSDDGTIVFTPNGTPGTSLMKVSDAGGRPEPFIKLQKGEATQRFPQVLPGGKAVIYTSSATGAGGYDDADIVVHTLPDGPRKVLQRGGYFGRYVNPGHLVFIHRATLFAMPFDVERLEASGQAVPIAENIYATTGTGSAQLAVSDNGALAYLTGAEQGMDAPMMWLGRDGTVTALIPTPSEWSNPAFSPDGARVAFDNGAQGGLADIAVYDLARGTTQRLTFDPLLEIKPVWAPDGSRIAYTSTRNGNPSLYWQRADGTGEAQQLADSGAPQLPSSFHPNGNLLLFHQQHADTAWDLYVLPLDGDEKTGWKPGKPRVLLNAAYSEQEAVFSPDGRWIAYQSNEGGPYEIFVRPFEGTGGKRQISNGGGMWPSWSQTRNELFYQGPNGQLMFVPFTASESFAPGTIRQVPGPAFMARPRLRSVALHPDGDRFAIAPRPTSTPPRVNTIILRPNFGDELKRVVRTAR